MTDLDRLRNEIESARSSWQGCVRPTEFGPRSINLCGLRSRQAILAFKATRGEESKCWEDAARWLIEVERAAETAAELACLAMNAANLGDFETAARLLDEAVVLETIYDAGVGYQNASHLCQQLLGQETKCLKTAIER